MMRTSDSCLRSNAGVDRPPEGFSLLEMLVVLLLVSVMAALIAPRLATMVQAIACSGDRAEAARQIERLPLLARAGGHPFIIEAGEPVVAEGMQMPQGWKVTASTRVVIQANGVCMPAKVRVEGGGVVEEWALAAPDCGVTDEG